MRANIPTLALPGKDADESAVVTAVCRSIDAFANKAIDARAIDRDHRIAPELLDEIRDLGLFGLSIPEEYGGAGLGLQGTASAIATLCRHDRSVATTVGLHSGLGTRGMVAFGTEKLRQTYLPDMASGSRIGSFATTEAEAGSDLTAIKTTAVAHGDGLKVDGTKAYVTNAGFAKVFTITASTPGLGGQRRGHSMLVLERDDAGVRFGPEEDKLGLRGSSTRGLYLDGLEIPMDRVIGTPGLGMSHLSHVLAWGRTVMASGCCGVAKRAFDQALDQVTTRRQFGRPIGTFDVVRRQVADLAASHYMMTSLVRYACAAEHDEATLFARSLAAKVVCSESAWEASDLSVQLHGGSGFIEETGLPLLLRDARIMRIFEGANDVLLVHAGAIEARTHQRGEPLEGRVGGHAAPLAARADALAERLATLRAELTKAHGIRLFGMQDKLHRLGRLFVLCEATDAAVLRAEAEGDERSALLAEHWLHTAEDRVQPALRGGPAVGPIADLTTSLYEGIQG